MSLLDGGMDDPDGSDPDPSTDSEAGWDVDPVVAADAAVGEGDEIDADGDAVSDAELIDVPELDGDDDFQQRRHRPRRAGRRRGRRPLSSGAGPKSPYGLFDRGEHVVGAELPEQRPVLEVVVDEV